MNKVVSINLNGNAYQLEEPGFDALSAYLERAKAALTGNPDQAEILADLEQAVADKCRRCLSATKSVVTAGEIASIIDEMGPVGESGEAGADAAKAGPKKLYRIEEGEWIGGVATGFAAYFDIDVVIVRLAIVLLTIFTSGGFALAYFIAWMIIPPARTQEERAAASGAAFNAEEVIARAKAEYAKLEGRSAEWQKKWRKWHTDLDGQHSAHKAWKRERRALMRENRYARPSFMGELMQVLVVSFALWLGYHYVSAIHDFLDAAWRLWLTTADRIAAAIRDQM